MTTATRLDEDLSVFQFSHADIRIDTVVRHGQRGDLGQTRCGPVSTVSAQKCAGIEFDTVLRHDRVRRLRQPQFEASAPSTSTLVGRKHGGGIRIGLSKLLARGLCKGRLSSAAAGMQNHQVEPADCMSAAAADTRGPPCGYG